MIQGGKMAKRNNHFLERNLAIVDLETTGLNPEIHEIIEIGLVLIRQKDFSILEEWGIKVKPKFPERLTPQARQINGFTNAGWQGAIDLNQAITVLKQKVGNAVLAAHNICFDWSFLNEAFKKTRIIDPFDYHRFDLWTIAAYELRNSGLKDFRLDGIAKFLGLEEELKPHQALNGAKLAYQVLKRLREKPFRILKNGEILASAIPGRFAGYKKDKIFGRLNCKSGMRIKKENRVFFLTWEDAISVGYRPCKNCKPQPEDEYERKNGFWCLIIKIKKK